jgi:hypothetical protein
MTACLQGESSLMLCCRHTQQLLLLLPLVSVVSQAS